MTPLNIGISASGVHDEQIAAQLERELPGFWAYFSERHPKFGLAPNNKAGPVGWVPAAEAYEAIGETITAYVGLRGRPMTVTQTETSAASLAASLIEAADPAILLAWLEPALLRLLADTDHAEAPK